LEYIVWLLVQDQNTISQRESFLDCFSKPFAEGTTNLAGEQASMALFLYNRKYVIFAITGVAQQKTKIQAFPHESPDDPPVVTTLGGFIPSQFFLVITH
jgi:hypothetical protein